MAQLSLQTPYSPDAPLVAAHNDAFRRSKLIRTPTDLKLSGVVVHTLSIEALDRDMIFLIHRAIAAFTEFTPDNDPDGYHDFGSVEVRGQVVWFKIDLFEARTNKMWGAETPDVPETTERVMTIMLPSDW